MLRLVCFNNILAVENLAKYLHTCESFQHTNIQILPFLSIFYISVDYVKTYSP